MNKDRININNVVTIPFGEKKMAWVPVKEYKKQKHNTFPVMLKQDGIFTDRNHFAIPYEDGCLPTVALKFKNKKSIDSFILMLQAFKKHYYGKTDKQLEEENNAESDI